MSGIFGSPSPPPVPKVQPMPDLNDPAILAAQNQVMQSAMARSGRLATILTGGGGNSGNYSGSTLGTP